MFYAIMAAMLPGFIALCFIGYQLKRGNDTNERVAVALERLVELAEPTKLTIGGCSNPENDGEYTVTAPANWWQKAWAEHDR